MPSDRKIRENILVPTGTVVAPNKYLYSLDGELASLNDSIGLGDIVFYDPRNNMTVGPGVTPTQVPKLGIAVALDKEGKGYPTVLRKVFGDSLNSFARDTMKLTTESTSFGCNHIMDFYTTCTFKGESYSIEIHTRGASQLTDNNWNDWRKETFTVNLKDYACESCEFGIDCKAVMCALAHKINSHFTKRNVNRSGKLLKRMSAKNAESREWTAYALFENDCIYTITNASPNTCTDCTHITGINGITIGANPPVIFNTASLIGGVSLTSKEKKERVLALINKAFRDAKVEGSAVLDEQLVGSGAPCADFKIRVNSCVTFDLLDANNAPLPKVCSNPFQTITTDPECVGCTPGSSWTPTCGLRVVAHPTEIICDCNEFDRTYWFHREIRIAVPDSMNNWSKFVTKTIQKPLAPKGLGIQWQKRIIDMSNGGPGYAYDNFVNDMVGLYGAQRKNTALKASTQGLECRGEYCSINIEHGLRFTETGVSDPLSESKGRSIILVNNKHTALYAAIKAVLDPWLGALGYKPINCGADVDQIEPIDYETEVVTTDPSYDPSADEGESGLGTIG